MRRRAARWSTARSGGGAGCSLDAGGGTAEDASFAPPLPPRSCCCRLAGRREARDDEPTDDVGCSSAELWGPPPSPPSRLARLRVRGVEKETGAARPDSADSSAASAARETARGGKS